MKTLKNEKNNYHKFVVNMLSKKKKKNGPINIGRIFQSFIIKKKTTQYYKINRKSIATPRVDEHHGIT